VFSPLPGTSLSRKTKTALAGERVVILSDGLWRRRFGSETGMIGKTITLNGSVYTVVGIMPAGFEYDGVQDVFVPMGVNPAVETKGTTGLSSALEARRHNRSGAF